MYGLRDFNAPVNLLIPALSKPFTYLLNFLACLLTYLLLVE